MIDISGLSFIDLAEMTELRSIKIRGLWGWNEAVELETEPLESAGMKIQHELTYIAHGDISISYPNLI